jgi:hypothetical protein
MVGASEHIFSGRNKASATQPRQDIPLVRNARHPLRSCEKRVRIFRP